jgi:hypothetical protein
MPEVKWLKEIAEGIESGKQKLLSEKDTFEFECTACGECCFGQDILLNPVDIYKMVHSDFAKKTGIKTTKDLFDMEFVHWFRGSVSRAPIARITVKEKGGPCPFLIPAIGIRDEVVVEKFQKLMREENLGPGEAMDKLGLKIERFLCGLHADGSKPTVCKSSPLGRIYKPDGIAYIVAKPIPTCPGMEVKKTQVVGEWLKKMKLDDQYRHSPWFFDFISDSHELFKKMDDQSSMLIAQTLYNPDHIALVQGVSEDSVPTQVYDVDEYVEFVRLEVEAMIGIFVKYQVSEAADLMKVIEDGRKERHG